MLYRKTTQNLQSLTYHKELLLATGNKALSDKSVLTLNL